MQRNLLPLPEQGVMVPLNGVPSHAVPAVRVEACCHSSYRHLQYALFAHCYLRPQIQLSRAVITLRGLMRRNDASGIIATLKM